MALHIVPQVEASETDGTINSVNRYAWCENVGWIDFGSTEGNVHVTDSALTGYAWGENIGWISLNCSNDSSCSTVDYKVTNNGEGVMGGHAWSENAGWIVFNPSGGGVTINSSGIFSGYAWAENKGWISFNCSDENSCATADYKVSTDWRPQSARSSEESASTETTSTPQSGGSRGGSGSPAMRARISRARETIIARFRGMEKSMQVADQKKDEEDASEVLAKQREKRIAIRIHERKAEIAALKLEKEELERKYAEKRERYIAHMISMKEERLREREAELQKEQIALEEEQERNKRRREISLAHRDRKEKKAQAGTSAADAPMSLERIAERRGRLYAMVGNSHILFSDVRVDEWYAPYISYVVEENIATGYRDINGKPTGEFGAANPITIAETLKMSLESAEEDLIGISSPRNSSARGTWASAYVAKAEELHLTIMTPGKDVHKSATRGEVISIILQILRFPLRINEELVAQHFSDLPENLRIAVQSFLPLYMAS